MIDLRAAGIALDFGLRDSRALSASRRDRLRDLWPRSVGTWGFVLYVYLCVLADGSGHGQGPTRLMLKPMRCVTVFTYDKLFHQLEEIVSELLRYLWKIRSYAHQSFS